MKTHVSLSLLSILALAPWSYADCPEHFSDAAKEKLADSVELEKPAYKLNVVYFTGNDNEPIADYQRCNSSMQKK